MGVTQPQVSPLATQAGSAGFSPAAGFSAPPSGPAGPAGPMPGISGAVAPPVMNTPPAPTLPMPAPRVGPVNYASSVPLGPIPGSPPPNASSGPDGLPEIPPPQQLAPHVFSPPASFTPPPMPVSYPGNYQNNFYNYPAQPPVPPMQPPQPQRPPALQQPPPQPQRPPAQPPQQPPAQLQQPAPPQQQPATPPPPTPAPSAQQIGAGGLDNQRVKDLNTRLNSTAATIRGDAAMDFFKTMEASPALADNPQYKPYVDAFMEKILNDPSPLVRQPGLLAMEMGYVKNPSSNARQLLDSISRGNGLYNIEPGIAQNILGALTPATNSATPAAANAAPAPAQAAATPGMPAAARFSGSKLNVVSHDNNAITGAS